MVLKEKIKKLYVFLQKPLSLLLRCGLICTLPPRHCWQGRAGRGLAAGPGWARTGGPWAGLRGGCQRAGLVRGLGWARSWSVAGGPAAWAGPGLAASGRGWHAGCAGDCQRAGGRWAWQVGSSAGLGERLVGSRWAGCLPRRSTACGQAAKLGWRWRPVGGAALGKLRWWLLAGASWAGQVGWPAGLDRRLVGA